MAHSSEAEAESAAAAYKRGLALFGQERLSEAVAAYDEALALRPDWTDPLQAKGMALLKAGRLDEALAVLLRVTELAPTDPLAFTSLSMAYVRMERIDEAEAAQAKARMLVWQEEVRTNPDAPMPDTGRPPDARPAGQ